jgi:hypothetical protein
MSAKKTTAALKASAASIGDNAFVITKEFQAGLNKSKAFGIEAKNGEAAKAKATLNFALTYRDLCESKVIKVSDMEARKLYVAAFRPDSSEDSLKTLRGQVGSFGHDKVLNAIKSAAYLKLVPTGGDFFAKCCKVNTGIIKADKVTVNATWVESRLEEKGESRLTKKEIAALPAKKQLPIVYVSLAAAIAPFKDAKIRNAANLSPAQDKALTTLLALIDSNQPKK